MKKTLSHIFISLLAVSLISCAPVRTEYFQPISTGQYSPITCGGGPSNKITVPISRSVTVKAFTQITDKENLLLYISYDVPENNIIKLTTNEFKIITKTTDNTLYVNNFRAMSTSHIKDSAPESRVVIKTPNDELDGESYTHETIWHKTLLHRNYNVNFEKYDIKADKAGFILELPPILVNGTPTETPAIHFKRESGIFVYAINC